MIVLQLFGDGPGLPSIADAVGIAGSVVLILMLVAMAGIAYKSLVGDGIEWPEDRDDPDHASDGVSRGDDEDDWKYY